MYLTEVFFRIDNARSGALSVDPAPLINPLVDQWRYNGQIIGREIPLFYAEQEGVQGVGLKVICPEQHSLLPEHNNQAVDLALARAEAAGFIFDSVQIVADDLNADSSYQGGTPAWQVLYTTYLQSCSPLHSGEDLRPIPLYRQLRHATHLSMDLIKWQENWQACDQLQMNGAVLEQAALKEIADIHSPLAKHGDYLCRAIEQHSGIPTYYYLYHVGSKDIAREQQRRCPRCQGDWRLDSPLFDLFYFKCDRCRLVSNFAWYCLT